MNNYIIDRKRTEEEDQDQPPDDASESERGEDSEKNPDEAEKSSNRGTMILNATCVPQNVRFPTDVFAQ